MDAAAQASITSLLRAYGASLASRQVHEAVDLYTLDGVIMAPANTPSSGTSALSSAYERIFSTIKLEITFSIDEIISAGEEWAFARSTAEGMKYWIQQGTDERHWNQELFVLKKELGGAEAEVDRFGGWRIARYAFSSMKPIV